MGEPLGGVGLILNATSSPISSVNLSTGGGCGGAAAWTLFPASEPAGVSTLAGCSFPMPPGGHFTIAVQFASGEQPIGSVNTLSTATPAVVVVAFLNLLIVAQPNGRASQMLGVASLAAAQPPNGGPP